jgi:hypothetical protein
VHLGNGASEAEGCFDLDFHEKYIEAEPRNGLRKGMARGQRSHIVRVAVEGDAEDE